MDKSDYNFHLRKLILVNIFCIIRYNPMIFTHSTRETELSNE